MASTPYALLDRPGSAGPSRKAYGLSMSSGGDEYLGRIESSERLGRRRRAIERTMPWLTGRHRLNHRYERQSRSYLVFLGLGAALCCYKRLIRLIAQDTVQGTIG